MNIALAIMHLFPKADPRRDFQIRDDRDGKGPYIAEWNIDSSKPSEAELQAAWEAYLAEEAAKPPAKSLEQQLAESLAIQTQLRQELAVQKDINTANSQNFMDLVDYLTTKGVLE